MRRIDLVFFTGCPHVEQARRRLRRALMDAGHPPQWYEWDVAEEQTPDAFRGYGSPTVLVDGRDVAGGVRGSGVSCVATGAPTSERLAAALAEGAGGRVLVPGCADPPEPPPAPPLTARRAPQPSGATRQPTGHRG